MDKTFILILEDSKTQLEEIKYILSTAGFYVIPFSSPVSALNYLNSKESVLPDLIIADITMPKMDGYEFCTHVKNNIFLKDIPLIFLTGLTNDCNQSKGFDVGAVDYIFKPINAELIKKRIHMHCELKMHRFHLQELVDEKIKELELVQEITIECIANLAEYRDNETGGHIRRTREYIKVLVNELRTYPKFKKHLTDKYVKLLYQSAPLHDIGKVGIPDSILLKPGALTKEEFDIMKYHTLIGKKTLEIADSKMNKESFLHFAIEMAAAHHEKWDGTGYPLGLKGEDIPLIARLMAVADVYDALVSKRIYKDPIAHEEAINIIESGSGKQFDPEIVKAFLKVQNDIKKILEKYKDTINDENDNKLENLVDNKKTNSLAETPNCWEIMKCGIEGSKDCTIEGETCPVYRSKMGHSCWILAGIFSHNKYFCKAAKKNGNNCLLCEVYKLYSRSNGILRHEILRKFPEENKQYYHLIKSRKKEEA
jgi:putative two-component system response regulator